MVTIALESYNSNIFFKSHQNKIMYNCKYLYYEYKKKYHIANIQYVIFYNFNIM